MPVVLNIRISAEKLPYYLIALCAFSIPIGSGINIITGIPFSKIFLAAVLLMIFYAFLFMKFARYMIPFFMQLYLAFILVHSIVTYFILKPEYLYRDYYGELFLISLIRFYVLVFFYLFIIQFLKDEKLLKHFTLYYSLGYALTIILGLFVPQSELDMGRINGGFENPNSFGASSIMLVFLNLYQWILHSKNKTERARQLIFVVLGLTGLALSQSRGALAGLLAGLFVFLLWMPGLERKIKIFTGIGVTVGLVILLLPSEITQQFLERAHIGERINTGSESRIIIWSSYIKELPEYWLFGAGRNQSHEIISNYNLPPKWRAPHNRYLFILAEFGSLALLSFILGIIQLSRKTYYKDINDIRSRMLRSYIVVWMVMILFGDYKNSRDFWLFLALITALSFLSGKNELMKLKNTTAV